MQYARAINIHYSRTTLHVANCKLLWPKVKQMHLKLTVKQFSSSTQAISYRRDFNCDMIKFAISGYS